MSETERNDDGTFAAGEPDTSGLFGREERLGAAGYTVRKDATEEHATPDYPDGDPVHVQNDVWSALRFRVGFR